MRRTLAALSLAALLAVPALAQEPAAPPSAPGANAADVESVEAIVAALYDVISGAVGEPRDWDRMRSLFVPGALLVPAAPRPDGTAPPRVLGVEDWIAGAERFFAENAFYEREIGPRRTQQFGNVVNVMSPYGSFREPDGEAFARGVNSITLVSDGARWYTVSIAWDVDREGNPLPDDMVAPTAETAGGGR